MATQQRYTRFNPAQFLESAWATMGEEAAKELGLIRNGYQRFNYSHSKTLEGVVGNIVVTDLGVHLNSSEAEDGIVRNYGGLTGKGGINLNGQTTLRSNIPAIVLADRKSNTAQRTDVRESFARLCKNHGKMMDRVEVNPASVQLFQETSMQDGVSRALVVIEAAGIFGEDSDGNAFYWSIMQYPLDNYRPQEETPKPKAKRASGTRRSRSTGSSNAPESNAGVEKEMVTTS